MTKTECGLCGLGHEDCDHFIRETELDRQREERLSEVTKQDIRSEFWREYDFSGRVYRIESPQDLYSRSGGTTHRVVDREGVTHCVPAPGVNGCVLRWKADPPVSF